MHRRPSDSAPSVGLLYCTRSGEESHAGVEGGGSGDKEGGGARREGEWYRKEGISLSPFVRLSIYRHTEKETDLQRERTTKRQRQKHMPRETERLEELGHDQSETQRRTRSRTSNRQRERSGEGENGEGPTGGRDLRTLCCWGHKAKPHLNPLSREMHLASC